MSSSDLHIGSEASEPTVPWAWHFNLPRLQLSELPKHFNHAFWRNVFMLMSFQVYRRLEYALSSHLPTFPSHPYLPIASRNHFTSHIDFILNFSLNCSFDLWIEHLHINLFLWLNHVLSMLNCNITLLDRQILYAYAIRFKIKLPVRQSFHEVVFFRFVINGMLLAYRVEWRLPIKYSMHSLYHIGLQCIIKNWSILLLLLFLFKRLKLYVIWPHIYATFILNKYIEKIF